MTAAIPGEPAEAAIRCEHASRVFASGHGVHDLNLRVPSGSIFGFIGPSGSGKTTTVRLLTGALTPDSGTVRVLGSDPATFSPAERARIGYMPQLSVLYRELSVRENLNFYAGLYGLGSSSRRRQELLEFVELAEHDKTKASDLSGGMQRRVSLAAALVHDPDLLFLDEPTAGIDPVLRRKFWDHFADLKARGRTLFVTTQYVGEAAYCDYVGVLSDGELLMVATPTELRRSAFGGDVLAVVFRQPLTADRASHVADHLGASSHRLVDYRTLQIVVDDGPAGLAALSTFLADQAIEVDSAEEVVMPFDDVFVAIIEQHRQEQAEAANA